MAPSFLSKLVKQPNGAERRDRSLSSPSPPDTVPRSRTASTVENAGSMSSRTSGSNGTGPSRANSLYTRSGNPSVTVIPPSPVVTNDAVPPLPTYRPPSHTEGLPVASDGSSQDSHGGVDRSPAPTKPVPSVPLVGRPPTPKNKERTPQSSPKVSIAELPSVRPSSSNKSLKGKAAADAAPPPVPSSAPSSHIRAAAAPSSAVSHESEPTPTLSDSPTALKPAEFPQTSPASSISIGSAKRRDTDMVSIMSQTGQKKSTSRPWRRSTPKKPVGLAGAIAASGLAMANPALTAPQQSTLSPQVMNTNENKSSPSLVTSPMQNPSAARRLTTSPESNHRRVHSNGAPNGKSREKTDHRRRRTTGSVVSHGDGETYSPDEQGEYYSGLESSDDDSGDDSSDGGSGLEDLDLGEDDIPVTGFAVASNKRNADFHELFPGIPEGDYLIEDYGCALQREILIQGRLYVSENHLCFHANIFGWVTDLLIPIYEITTLEKRMTAFVIPNAIRVGTGRVDYTFASFLSRDTTFDVIHNIWRLVRPTDAASIGSGSLEADNSNLAIPEGTIIGAATGTPAVATPARKATTCACGREGKHFAEVAMDTVLPGTPDRIYNLMFASGFMKDFLSVNQKLLDIQVSDWTPTTPGSKLLARNMSYIKPLTASLGPKQTKCEIRDETVHVDFDDYISTLTTTRNPDVPSGGVFSVKTRTCIMWASPLTTKVVVSTFVEWTGRSFIKGIIEKSAIDGQRTYHGDLEKAMRAYIQEHQAEFMPAGVDVTAVVPAPVEEPKSPTAPSIAESISENKKREVERNQRGLQWAYDTFAGAYSVAKQSTKGALELLHDAWDQSSSTTILILLIVVLVISNVWTYIRMGSAVTNGRRKEKELAKVGDQEQWVAGVVTALWDELAAGKMPPQAPLQVPPAVGAAVTPEVLKQELNLLQSTLDTVEERVRLLRQTIGELNKLD
ncbi:VASt domain-containing protein [Mycena kentingensis (nom. inval.)]|nr:VASt domain-containing protein [Mycena kentingensis (nom. inval.)]